MPLFPGFTATSLALPTPMAADGPLRMVVRHGGHGPPLLLLHGFPQTHAMWHRVAQRLAGHFSLVMPDLRGYGDSGRPAGGADHAGYSKRAMADDVHQVMLALGHERYGVVGHDRGGRVAHRLALDQPHAVQRLMLLDIAPTLDMYAATDFAFACAYDHWFHLIQPAPLPERMLAGDAIGYLHAKLGGWGAAGLAHVEPEALAEYERCFTAPGTIHAMCEDYRASAGIDLEHDRASRACGQRIACPTRVLWGARGVVHRLFEPLGLWQAQCALPVSGATLDTGHFMPEEAPQAVADQIAEWWPHAPD